MSSVIAFLASKFQARQWVGLLVLRHCLYTNPAEYARRPSFEQGRFVRTYLGKRTHGLNAPMPKKFLGKASAKESNHEKSQRAKVVKRQVSAFTEKRKLRDGRLKQTQEPELLF